VDGKSSEDADSMGISRVNVVAGLIITKNVFSKVEYVKQEYSGDGLFNV